MRITTVVLATLFCAAPARAEEKAAPPSAVQSILTYFQHVRDSLSQSAVSGQRKHGRVGSVAAVRGKDQASSLADPDEPVLKGDFRAKKERVAAAEDAEFAAAVDLVLKNKIDDGIQALEAFKARHPKSRDLAKVQESIDQAKALSAASAPQAGPR